MTTEIWNDTYKLIIIFGIASSILYLHSFGIIHLDMKPMNIVIDEFLFPRFLILANQDFKTVITKMLLLLARLCTVFLKFFKVNVQQKVMFTHSQLLCMKLFL